jgi:gentisate 1,2-dioxygenase
MPQLSNIQASPEELQDYYAELRAQHVTPAWIGSGISIEPSSEAVPYLWRGRELRPQAMRAAELVGTQQAERRVLRLTNPKLPGAARGVSRNWWDHVAIAIVASGRPMGSNR